MRHFLTAKRDVVKIQSEGRIDELRVVYREACEELLHANGESMIDAGIEDGDLVLVSKQNYADEGQIVVALIDDEATLKRYYPEPQKHRVRLHPENKTMKDIYAENCIIQGVAVKVLKDLV